MSGSRRKRYLAAYPLYLLLVPPMLILAFRANASLFRGLALRAIQNGAAFLALAFLWHRLDWTLTCCGGRTGRLRRFLAYCRGGGKDSPRRCFRNVTIDRLLKKYARNPVMFEHYVGDLYRRLGYSARVTKASGDGGIDVHLWRDGQRYAVEVKLYARERHVGREHIQKLWAAQHDAGADGAIFVTTSSFTGEAEAFARRHDIRLVDGESLSLLIRRAAMPRRRFPGR